MFSIIWICLILFFVIISTISSDIALFLIVITLDVITELIRDFSKLSGSKDSIRKQIGMAITPKGLEIICNAILSSLYKVNYENVMPNIDD